MKNVLYEVMVARKAHEAVEICSFDLVAPGGGSLPPFSAEAHIDVQGPSGLVRQYSLCHDPEEKRRYLTGVLRDVRDVLLHTVAHHLCRPHRTVFVRSVGSIFLRNARHRERAGPPQTTNG